MDTNLLNEFSKIFFGFFKKMVKYKIMVKEPVYLCDSNPELFFEVNVKKTPDWDYGVVFRFNSKKSHIDEYQDIMVEVFAQHKANSKKFNFNNSCESLRHSSVIAINRYNTEFYDSIISVSTSFINMIKFIQKYNYYAWKLDSVYGVENTYNNRTYLKQCKQEFKQEQQEIMLELKYKKKIQRIYKRALKFLSIKYGIKLKSYFDGIQFIFEINDLPVGDKFRKDLRKTMQKLLDKFNHLEVKSGKTSSCSLSTHLLSADINPKIKIMMGDSGVAIASIYTDNIRFEDLR